MWTRDISYMAVDLFRKRRISRVHTLAQPQRFDAFSPFLSFSPFSFYLFLFLFLFLSHFPLSADVFSLSALSLSLSLMSPSPLNVLNKFSAVRWFWSCACFSLKRGKGHRVLLSIYKNRANRFLFPEISLVFIFCLTLELLVPSKSFDFRNFNLLLIFDISYMHTHTYAYSHIHLYLFLIISLPKNIMIAFPILNFQKLIFSQLHRITAHNQLRASDFKASPHYFFSLRATLLLEFCFLVHT